MIYKIPITTNKTRFTLQKRGKPLYTCREASTNSPFYAKQTQFAGHSNERKLCFNKGLCQYAPSQTNESKPKANPICEKQKMNVSLYITRAYEKNHDFRQLKTKPKQSQSNPIQNQRLCGHL